MQTTDTRPRGRGLRIASFRSVSGTYVVAGAIAAATACLIAAALPTAALVVAILAGFFALLALVTLRYRRRLRESRAVIALLGVRLEETQDRIWELSEDLDRQRGLVDAQGDAIYRRDTDGRITFVNDAFRRMFGLSRDADPGEVAIPEPLDPVEDDTSPGLPRTMIDARYETADGVRWLQWQDAPIRDSGGAVIEVQCVGRDVTMRREVEDALRRARDAAEDASRAKSRFLAAVSHEIRTPMSGIIGMADLLLDSGLTPEQTTYARAVHGSAEALLDMIDEILDFSRIEAGRIDLADEPYSLAKLVSDVAELLAPRAEDKGLEIAAFVSREVPAVVRGDPDRLRQVLVNLAANGIKFTDRGGVSISVRPDRGENDAGADGIAIVVADTGIGIAETALGRIFEEFEQAEAGPARKHGGAGLGLAICKRIVTAMGGDIVATSTPGRGSALTVRLPAGEQTEAAVRPGSLARRRILVASPSPVLRSVLRAMLEDEGARVDAVARAETLVRRLAAPAPGDGRAFDTVLVDLPFADAIDPGDGPAIVMLSPRDRGVLPDMTRRGFGGYLIKPIRSQSLLARLGAATSRAGTVAGSAVQDDQAGPALSVLLAEDNDLNAMLTEALLRRLGHHVTRVRDGVQAVKKVKAGRERGRPYDVALMDIHMPNLDGLSAARQVRAGERETPAAGRVVLIALTANTFSEDRDACLEAGMDMFLSKPVDREALAASLKRVRPFGALVDASGARRA